MNRKAAKYPVDGACVRPDRFALGTFLPTAFRITANSRQRLAFSLLELLVVMAIIAVMVGLIGPSLSAIKGAGGVSGASTEIAATLEQARAYAMSKKTYTYVGFLEGDALDENRTPDGSTVGRLIVAVGAANDGSRNAITIGTNPAIGNSGITMVSKLLVFTNVHLTDLSSFSSGRMERPSVPANFIVGNTAFLTNPAVKWQISHGKSDYTFLKVIQFDPQGSASAVQTNQGNALARRLEIALQQTHGNQPPPAPSSGNPGNIAAIQIDGLSGAITYFRP